MGACGGYRRRTPEQTVLHQAVREGWPEVERQASERGGLPKRVKEEVRRYLECGVLQHGFALVKCTTCSESRLVGFLLQGTRLLPLVQRAARGGDVSALRGGAAVGGVPAVDALSARTATAAGGEAALAVAQGGAPPVRERLAVAASLRPSGWGRREGYRVERWASRSYLAARFS